MLRRASVGEPERSRNPQARRAHDRVEDARGFQRRGLNGRWEHHKGDLIARIIEAGWVEAQEVTYQIEKEGEWVLELSPFNRL